MRLAAQVAGYAVLVVVSMVGLAFALWLLVATASSVRADCDQRFPHCIQATASVNNGLATKSLLARRPAGCPRAWCGCWLALHQYGRHVRSLWLARAWARVGRPAAGPAPGVIAVFKRGRGGHVGIVTRVTGPGMIVLLSGNDGRAVRERERSTRGVIAYRVL